jgi:hypothetical protein
VLYVSIGKPRKAIGVDIGQGVVVRYDEEKREVVGLTILAVRQRVAESLATQSGAGRRNRRGRAQGRFRSRSKPCDSKGS